MRALAVICFSLGLAFATAAQAVPVSTQLGASRVDVIKVAGGCGWNGIRGPYGHCRRRFTCPPGWHPGPHGWHCFRNW
jgi:hypothetical protein